MGLEDAERIEGKLLKGTLLVFERAKCENVNCVTHSLAPYHKRKKNVNRVPQMITFESS